MTTATRKWPVLTEDLWAVGIHGVTGQDVEEGDLAAGTLIREVASEESFEGPVYYFLASTDGGRLWYRQRSYSRPKVS